MPPPKTKKQQTRDDLVIAFKLDGVDYRLARADVSPRLEMELPAGKSMAAAIHALHEAQGGLVPWALAVLVFMARRTGGETVTFDQILDSIGWDVDIELVDEAGVTGPEV